MTLNTVTLKWDLTDLIEAGLSATLAITPTAQLSDTTDHILIPAVTRSVTFSGGTGQLPGIVANDNSSLQPAGSGYLISVTSQSGKVLVAQFQTQLNFSNGAIQWLDALAVVPVVATGYQYVPLPGTGPSSTSQVLGVSQDSPLITEWVSQSGGGGVSWVNAVTAYGADPTGGTDSTAAIQNALLSFGTLGGWLQGEGGVVYLPQGRYTISKTLIIPSGVTLWGSGWGSQLTMTAAGYDMIQTATYNSSSQAAILGVSASAITNGFWCGVRDLALHGFAFSQVTAGYSHGINVTTNPVNSAAGSDPDFDPCPTVENVRIEACTGDAYYHSGRSGASLKRVLAQYCNGNGYSLSFDTTAVDCLAEKCNTGFYLNHGSVNGTGCKSYNNLDNTWVSGHSYTAGNVAVYSGTMYFCISAASGSTAPPSDAGHWTALSATSPQATGYGYYWDTNAAEHSWAAVDAQQNSAGDYYFKGGATARPISVQGSSNGVNFNNGQPAWNSANPNNYAAVTFDGVSGVTAVINSCAQSQNGIICKELNSPGSNTLIATTDLSEAALFYGGAFSGFALVNGRLCSQPAYLPITRDKASNLYTSGGASTATITFPENPSPGSTVLVAVANVSGTPVLQDNGTTPATFTDDVPNTSQTNNVHVFRANNITLPASGGYQISITNGGNTYAAAAVSYLGIAPGPPAGKSTSGGTSTAVAAVAATGGAVFAAFSDSNATTHTVSLNAPAFTSEFTSNASAGLGAFGAAGFVAAALPVTAETAAWTLGASSDWETAVAAYLPAWQIPANVTVTGQLDVATGSFSTTPLISSTDGTDTSHGALVHVLGANGSETGHYLLLYDATGPLYLGLAMALGAGHTLNGHPITALGGYFNGLGIQGSSSSGGNPVFGVLNSAQSGSGTGQTALTVYDTNKVVTISNTLDDGSGNAIVAGGLTTAVRTITSSGAVSATDSTVLLNAATLTATLPTAAGITGRQYTVKVIAASTGTVATTSSQTIDGSTTYSLSAIHKYVTVVSDGANWQIVANN